MSFATSDVLVVGAGVIGSSIAYHLARRGARVALFDRAQPAIEPSASWASAGGVRQQGRDPREWPLTLAAGRRWSTLADELETDIRFKRGGHLHVVESDADLADLDARIARDRGAGIDCARVQGSELRAIAPALTPSAIAGAFTPADGQADAVLTTRAFAAAADRLGAAVYLGISGLRLELATEGSVRVRIDEEPVATQQVVLAAGAWSERLAAAVGWNLPVRPRALQMLLSSSAPPTLEPTVTVNGRALSLKQLPDGAYLIGGAWPGDVDVEHMTYRVRPESVTGSWATAAAVVPAVAETHLARAWCGIEAHTVDLAPLVGPAPHIRDLYVATGFSGHGFQLAPAVGEAVAAALLGEQVLEIESLSPSRLASAHSQTQQRADQHVGPER